MDGNEFPLLEEILPHRAPMQLLSRVLAHEPERTICRVDIDDQPFFQDDAGRVPPWIALEYMAQCAAAHSGLVWRKHGESPKVGFLLGSRRVTFHSDGFSKGQRLQVSAIRVWGRATGMVVFDCRVEDEASGALLVEGRLNCYTPAEDEVPL
jgi:predicted hotdog family 3-hydroxylacyl-ACP dehydratase